MEYFYIMCLLDILMMKVMIIIKVLKVVIYKIYIFIILIIFSIERKYFLKKRNNIKGVLFIKIFMLNIFV